MTSIYEQALGAEFAKLHPRIQQRFGFSSSDRIASIGHGVMERVWYSKWALLPLFLGTFRHIMFPNGGNNIPFTIENYAYIDSSGRETITWIRKFEFPGIVRHFDATMVFSKRRQAIVDYLGNKQHLAVDLDLSVAPNGGLRICSGEQRFYEGKLQFVFPRLLTGCADVCEWYDDERDCYKISVRVSNKLLGTVFRYQGSFQASFIPAEEETIPIGIKPLRSESRE
ncbi:DUF4166 domain-containing protein [Paenibacillus harenae]|uniref:DUF4166 domain-containing protein n=1 Tax=Paenibacillus harenae TaxID=306543 RepID=A0ABT9TXW9_PAEHA|nr:DUF4166 domain-containing protein [Paenibacillus harenae]MDQ0111310.1 hypothetical protein [Paenibacillus harenae]